MDSGNKIMQDTYVMSALVLTINRNERDTSKANKNTTKLAAVQYIHTNSDETSEISNKDIHRLR